MSEDILALVIEDDFDASVIFAKALEVLGLKTEVIDSGDKALERLKVVVPDLILLDLHLPEVLGTSILRTIRADKRFSETLVIIATADPRSADLVQDLADLVLIKPTTFSQVRDLAARLTSSLRKRREEEAARDGKTPAGPVAEQTAPKEESPAAPVGEKLEAKADDKAAPEKEKTEVPNPAPDTGSRQA